MGLQTEFIAYAEEVGINREDLQVDQGDGFSAVTFGEQGEDETTYTVMIVFYEGDDEVEIFIGKVLESVDLLALLKRLNALNIEYRGGTFLYQADMATLKMYRRVNGQLQGVLESFMLGMEMAKKELSTI